MQTIQKAIGRAMIMIATNKPGIAPNNKTKNNPRFDTIRRGGVIWKQGM